MPIKSTPNFLINTCLAAAIILSLVACTIWINQSALNDKRRLNSVLIPVKSLSTELNEKIYTMDLYFKIILQNPKSRVYTKFIATRDKNIPAILSNLNTYKRPIYLSTGLKNIEDVLVQTDWIQWTILDILYNTASKAPTTEEIQLAEKKTTQIIKNIEQLLSTTTDKTTRQPMLQLYNDLLKLNYSIRDNSIDEIQNISNKLKISAEQAAQAINNNNKPYQVEEYIVKPLNIITQKFNRTYLLNQSIISSTATLTNRYEEKYNQLRQATQDLNNSINNSIENLLKKINKKNEIEELLLGSLSLVLLSFIIALIVQLNSKVLISKKSIKSLISAINEVNPVTTHGNNSLIDDLSNVTRKLIQQKQSNEKILDQSRQTLMKVAHFDPISGLMNEISFTKEFYNLTRLSKGGDSTYIVYLNLLHYRDYSMLFSESEVNRTVNDFCKKLVAFNKFQGLYARKSEAEFLIAIKTSKHNNGGLQILKDHILTCLDLSKLSLFLKPSIGITKYEDFHEDIYKLLQYCKFTSHEYKVENNIRSHLFNKSTIEKYNRQAGIKKDIRSADIEQQLYVVYQPQYEFKTGKIVGCEALIRWNHPVYGPIPPDEFISYAEQTGDIEKFSTYVRATALKDYQQWCKISKEKIRLSINASVTELVSPNFTDILCDELNQNHISPTDIEIEITETVFTLYSSNIHNTINELVKRGIGLAIDDFGKEYSSLDRLLNFEFQLLKIDKCFVDKIENNMKSRKLLESIIRLAKSINIGTIAEGVETQAQVDILKGVNCDFVQGYFYSKPITHEEMMALLKKKQKPK